MPFAGLGVIEGRSVASGNVALLNDLGVDRGALAARAETLRAEAQTVMFLAIGGEAAGLIGAADPVKASTREALTQLREAGLRVVMLTGDRAVSRHHEEHPSEPVLRVYLQLPRRATRRGMRLRTARV